MEGFECKVDGVVYSDKSTGFYILKVKSEQENTTVKGYFPGISMTPGLKAMFKGQWVDHPKYGRQLNASHCEIKPDKGRVGIVSYLISHVPSIGPITAGKLYGEFGDGLVTILEDNPDQILDCSFLTKNQAQAILDEWKEASEIRNTSIFLTDLGLTSYQVRNVYKEYGTMTIPLVKDNPYCLCDCLGVGFTTADSVAQRLGLDPNDPSRVRAIIMFAMDTLSSTEGHMWVTSDQIRGYMSTLFRRNSITPFSHGDHMTDSQYYPALRTLKESGEIVSHGKHLYLARNWELESESAKAVARMNEGTAFDFGDLKGIVSDFEGRKNIQFSPEQKQAIYGLSESRVVVISGFPGTGKTTLISAFCHLFEEVNIHYELMSPTGIAAKRLSQVTGKKASTIHRALGYNFEGWSFDKYNKYSVQAVIVDEMSMVDADTFYHLVTALPDDCILILIGDSAQLPSVGAGYVLNSMMRCDSIPHVSLTRIYRQEKQSDIVKVAHAILAGEEIDTEFNSNSEFLFFNYRQDEVLDEIKKITSVMKDDGSNFQVIAPKYDGELGVNNLNNSLREVLNTMYSRGNATRMKHGASDMYEGDRVMIVKNDYRRMIFNGDVGKVQRISLKDNEVEIRIFGWFDHESDVPRYIDKNFIFTIEEAKFLLKVAYACTTHKVQGQEFDFVIIPMTMQYGIMLYRNLIYTAITRAKKKVFIFGDPKAFYLSVFNERELDRNSLLNVLINDELDKSKQP